MLRKAKYAVVSVAAIAAVVAYGNTGTVTASLDGDAFSVSFANHAHETNSLWVVYDGFDYGPGTNGWGHVERLGMVMPETDSWAYAVPAGWGETVKAIRFILSEVPYDYDYSLDFIKSTGMERICLDDFTMNCAYRICCVVKMYKVDGLSGSPAVFTTREGTSDAPYFNLFWTSRNSWRFDYNDKIGTQVKTVNAGTLYAIDASSAGLVVNGVPINSKSASAQDSNADTSGKLQFFRGGNNASSPGNNLSGELYGAQIYDAPTDGNLLVNLVPMVKDGRLGMYDTVRDVYYYSDTGTDFSLTEGSSRIESADPFFADALCTAAATGPVLFTPATAVTVAQSITNAAGGILDGTATLTLAGENDWGGTFSVTNGTLVAAFGQGLAATDCLHLRSSTSVSTGAYGGYGGWNGRMTESFGSAAGQIYVQPGGYYAFCAADGGELEVNIGGAGEPWTATSDYRRLLLNGAPGAGTLHFVNPLAIADAFILRVGYGTVFFDQCVTNAADGTLGHTLNLYNGTDNVGTIPDNKCVFRGADNHWLNLRQYGGNYVLDEGTTNTIDSTFTFYSGSAMTFLATNAVVRLTGADNNGGWMYIYGGKAEFRGGELYAGGIYIGESAGQANVEAKRPCLVLNGKVYMEGMGTKSYGSLTIDPSARSSTLTVEPGADISLNNLVFHQRNIYHRGGRFELRGGQGVCQMGQTGGTSRYWLYEGAELIAPRFQGDYESASAQLVFVGGKLTTSSNAFSPFFQNFGSNSVLAVASADGAEFCVTKDTSVEKGLVEVPSSTLSGHSAWNYAAADWLTAPAFKKTGANTLTMSGTNTYKCATDVAAGTLALAGGENPGVLPTNGVTRVTGGTLDLGGNVQTVRALVGTAGSVANGTLIAKEGVYPGGAGAVGSFACGAALEGTLSIDVDATGACDQIVAQGTLDVSNIDLVLPTSLPAGVIKLQVVAGATTGTLRSVENLSQGWAIMPSPTGLWVRKIVGTTIIFR